MIDVDKSPAGIPRRVLTRNRSLLNSPKVPQFYEIEEPSRFNTMQFDQSNQMVQRYREFKKLMSFETNLLLQDTHNLMQ